MRPKDLISIIFVIIASGLFGLLIGRFVFSYKADSNEIKTMSVIDSNFEPLDPRFFNEHSINPTIRILIGQNSIIVETQPAAPVPDPAPQDQGTNGGDGSNNQNQPAGDEADEG